MTTFPDGFMNRHAVVTVTTETATRDDGVIVPVRYVVTGSSGFVATLAACGHDAPITPCEKPYGHPVPGKAHDRDKHNREHCHGWHDVSARRFAEEVLSTYGAKRKPVGAVGVPRGRIREGNFVPLRESVAA